MTDPFRLRVIHQGWNTFGIATIAEKDGTQVERALEDHGKAACVLPYDPEGASRFSCAKSALDQCSGANMARWTKRRLGGVENGDPREAAIREAYEEAGVRLTNLEQVFDGYSMPVVSSERVSLYLAPYSQADCIGRGGGLVDEGEQIVVLEVPLADLAERLAAGEINDMKRALLVQALRLRRPELFEPVDEAGG